MPQLFLVDRNVNISLVMGMIRLSILFLVLLVTTTYAQIGPDGTGTVNGYFIGPGVPLDDANLSDALLDGANLIQANLYNANLSGAVLINANLTNAYLSYADLTGANLSNADLNDAYLTYADLSGANLSNAELDDAYLSDADLTGANLTGADLSGTILNGVKSGNITGTPTLWGDYRMANGYIVGPNVDLTSADLTGADLSRADLSGTLSLIHI